MDLLIKKTRIRRGFVTEPA